MVRQFGWSAETWGAAAHAFGRSSHCFFPARVSRRVSCAWLRPFAAGGNHERSMLAMQLRIVVYDHNARSLASAAARPRGLCAALMAPRPAVVLREGRDVLIETEGGRVGLRQAPSVFPAWGEDEAITQVDPSGPPADEYHRPENERRRLRGSGSAAPTGSVELSSFHSDSTAADRATRGPETCPGSSLLLSLPFNPSGWVENLWPFVNRTESVPRRTPKRDRRVPVWSVRQQAGESEANQELTGPPAVSAWRHPSQARRILRRVARVAMMEAADHGVSTIPP